MKKLLDPITYGSPLYVVLALLAPIIFVCSIAYVTLVSLNAVVVVAGIFSAVLYIFIYLQRIRYEKILENELVRIKRVIELQQHVTQHPEELESRQEKISK